MTWVFSSSGCAATYSTLAVVEKLRSSWRMAAPVVICAAWPMLDALINTATATVAQTRRFRTQNPVRFKTIARSLGTGRGCGAIESETMLSRRDFLAGAVAALSAPVTAAAEQSGGLPRIGFLFYGSSGPAPEIEAFRKGLAEAGYIDAQNVAIEYRFASGRPERLPELATQLVALRPGVIVAPGTPAA